MPTGPSRQALGCGAMGTHRRAALAWCAVASLLAGCRAHGARAAGAGAEGAGGAPAPAASSVEGLTATLRRYRQDDVEGRIQIQVTNASGSDVVLDELQLRWPGWSEVPPVAGPTLLSPGRIVDLPIPVGMALCTNGAGFEISVPDPAAAVAVATAAVDGGPPQPVTIAVRDERGVLEGLYRPACEERALGELAELSFGTGWAGTTSEGRPAVSGVLRIVRHGGGARTVVLRQMTGTVLLDVEPAAPAGQGGPWAVLRGGEAVVELPVVLRQSGDCRPHALAESKHTFFLKATVEVDGGPTLQLYVRPDAEDEPVLLAMINRACGVG